MARSTEKLVYLEAITALSFFANDIKDGIYELSTFCVVSLGPVVSSSALPEDEVVWSEDLAEWSRANGVHGAWLQINKDGTGDVFASGSLIVVHIDPLQLKIGITMVGAGGVDAVLI